MLLKTLIFLCSAALLVSAASNFSTEPKPTLDKEVKSDVTDEINLTKNKTTTTPKTTTTSATTTTSTTPPTTTTTKTTTTTTTTTTSAPTTTTVAPPLPNPKDNKWSLNGTNSTCIVVQMAARFEITYPLNKTHNMTQKMNLPVDNVVVTGSCDAKEQSIILSWNSTKGSSNDSFTLHFVKDDKNGKYNLHHMDLVITPQELPNYNSTSNVTLKFMHVADEYPTKLGNSYRCMKESSFKMTNSSSNDTSAIVKLNDVQFQAFKSEKNTSFGLAEDCAFDTPDVVPIAVGCALAALVVIVLVAYLIGRRRAQARGYLSM